MRSAPVAGACLCGAVRFEVAPPTLFCLHCHCTMCGAAYVTWVGVPRGQFRVIAGDAQLAVHASSEPGRRSFCTRCGSSLLCENDAHPDHVDVVLANLEGPVDRAPEGHIYWSDRAPWVSAEDGLPRMGGDSGLSPVLD